MTTAKQASPFFEAVILSSISWPFLGAMLLATLPESVAFRLRFKGSYGSVLWALLCANLRSCTAGALFMLLICRALPALPDDEWAEGFRAAFDIFSYHPWLELCGVYVWLGGLLLVATPLEHRSLRRRPVFAERDPVELRAFVRRVHYVTFSILALLWLGRCWYLALHPLPFH